MNSHQLHLGNLFRSRREPGKAGLPVISVTMRDGLVHRDTLDRKDNGTLAPEEHLLVRKGDIAYNMMRMWQGASGLADSDGIVSPAYVVVIPQKDIDPLFAAYWFKSARMIYLFWAYSYGITGDRLRLYYKDFAQIPVNIPPKPEQERIGRVLATADRAIAGMEKLIAAKRTLKKGLAQQLLTGQHRLPGCNKPWLLVALGDMGRVVSGGTPDTTRSDFWDGEHPWCTPTDVTKCSTYIHETDRRITEQGLAASSAALLPKNSLVVCTRATIGDCVLTGVQLATNQGFKSIVFSKSYEPLFVFHSLMLHKHKLLRLANGSTFLEVSKRDFCRVELPMPQREKQIRIVAVLDAADRGIALLEKKLAALRELKKGLMQKLLTGPMPAKESA